jgi:FMN phosphatase YigB (HAD superfamily)
MRLVRGVIFDVDGTLVALRASIGELYAEALRLHGYDVSAHELERAAVQEWVAFENEYLNVADEYATQPSREVLVWCEFVRRVLQRAAPELSKRWDLIGEVYNFFSRGSSRRAIDGALDVCQALSARSIRVVAATNNDQRTVTVLSEMGFAPFFSDIITAGDLGWKKPSPKFFQGISERIQLPVAELLHVGNNHHFDVVAARDTGMQSVLFDPHAKGSPPRIGALGELLNLIKSQ